MDSIRMIYKPVGLPPTVLKVSTEMPDIKYSVGGFTDIIYLNSTLVVVLNEGWEVLDLRPNISLVTHNQQYVQQDTLNGNLFVAEIDSGHNFVDMQPDRIDKCLDYLRRGELSDFL